MAKRPVPKYDFKAFGAAIKAARTGRKESRKKVSDEMFISPRYLANIENKGQHPSLQIFFELMLRYNISVDQFLLETPPEKNTQRRQLDAILEKAALKPSPRCSSFVLASAPGESRTAAPTLSKSHTKSRYGRLRISSFLISGFIAIPPCPCS